MAEPHIPTGGVFWLPFSARTYKVAALDLSGMGDSGKRKEYNAGLRAEEIYGVIEDATWEVHVRC